MGDVLTFTPRPRPATIIDPISEPRAHLNLRDRIEAAAEVAVDTAERLIALLDSMDADPDLEDGGDDEPSLAAPENHLASQLTWLRGNDQDREAEAPETPLAEVVVEPASEALVLPWRGRGNVISAAGVAIIDLVGCRG